MARKIFISFADGRRFSTRRLAAEMERTGLFDEVREYGPHSLKGEFLTRHKAFFLPKKMSAALAFGFGSLISSSARWTR